MVRIDQLFHVKKGEGDYRENLGKGDTPLISATNTDNGVIAHVDIEPTFKAPAITVERVSGQAYVQLFDFATVPDDISVLIPKEKMSLKKLFYVASQVNLLKWKFCYSRKLTPYRLKYLEVDLTKFVDEDIQLAWRFPQKQEKLPIQHNQNLQLFRISDLFNIDRGDFHALDQLDEGTIPTVSRIAEDNGVTGYYEKPEDAELYSGGLLTVSTVSGDTFVQLEKFIATDNVLILKPKKPLRSTTLFFVQLAITLQKWRFSYGRQPYKRIFEKTMIYLPVKTNEEIDEDYIERLVVNSYGWNEVRETLHNATEQNSDLTDSPKNPHLGKPSTDC